MKFEKGLSGAIGFPRPILVCSRCLGFEACRYNGQLLHDPLVEALKPHVKFVTPCPEEDMGLGVPRHPVRVVEMKGQLLLMQLVTEKDVTRDMDNHITELNRNLPSVDGFLLKSRSPSCGLFDVKYYPTLSKAPPVRRGAGFLGAKVLQEHSGLAVEDEVRLGNERIRDHFLTKLFALADLRRIEASGRPRDLVEFQARNKLLLMSYSQKEMREMGRIVAHQSETGMEKALTEYRTHLQLAMKRGPRARSHINVLQHAFGYVSKGLRSDEREFFLDTVEMYGEGRTPLVALLDLMKSWILRFDVEYLKAQTYFSPYPRELMRKFDRYRSKDYWKEH